MILSRSLGVVFIKGRKVGGTSLEMALSVACGGADIVTPITPIDEWDRLAMGGRPRNFAQSKAEEDAYIHEIRRSNRLETFKIRHGDWPYFNHMSLDDIETRESSLGELTQIFIERDPYAKVLSLCGMRAGWRRYVREGDGAVQIDTLRPTIEKVMSTDFALVRNIDLYRGRNGKIAGRRLRYEALAEDYCELMRSLGVRSPAPLPHAKKSLTKQSMSSASAFNAAEIRQINDVFEDEFMEFGYRMIRP